MEAAERLQHLAETLGLTDDQKAKIGAIFKEEFEKSRAMMEDASLAPEDRRAKMRELREDSRTRARAVLTPEQQQKFDALPRPGRGPRGEGPGEAPPPPASGNL